jgi:hypothetical protein
MGEQQAGSYSKSTLQKIFAEINKSGSFKRFFIYMSGITKNKNKPNHAMSKFFFKKLVVLAQQYTIKKSLSPVVNSTYDQMAQIFTNLSLKKIKKSGFNFYSFILKTIVMQQL